jgi:hypothetical protein
VRKLSTFTARRFLQPGDLLVEPLQLLLCVHLALERLPGEILATRGERLAGLDLELGHVGLELRRLHLEALLRGRDVGDALLDLLQHLDLLLVRVVERDRRILRLVEHLRDARLDDRRRPAQEPWHVSS